MTPWLRSPLRRALDLVIAATALVVASPILLATAVAVRLKLGSPVVFRQERAGLRGTPIEIVKFRSMTDATDPDGALLPDADRLPPFGRMLRSTSLDELPQLWSVLRGDMSIIGPRPLPMTYNDRYTPDQRRRLLATPGITGWAQIRGRNGLDWPTKLAHDVWYVEHASPRVDLEILVGTVRALLGRSGVTADGHATAPEFLGTDTAGDTA
jgi:lipopolysaccharide/colanic/teichoic acid biosynthesis glycosyltransferase